MIIREFLYMCVPYANSQATHMQTNTHNSRMNLNGCKKMFTATLPARKSGSICPPTIHSIGLRSSKSQDRNMKIYENLWIVDGVLLSYKILLRHEMLRLFSRCAWRHNTTTRHCWSRNQETKPAPGRSKLDLQRSTNLGCRAAAHPLTGFFDCVRQLPMKACKNGPTKSS